MSRRGNTTSNPFSLSESTDRRLLANDGIYNTEILRFTVVGLPLLATDGVEHFSVPDPFDTVTTLSPVITRIIRD